MKYIKMFENEEVKNKKIFVLVGPPSVGKSTWIKSTFGEIEPYVISRDNLVEQVAAKEYGWTYDDLFASTIKDEKEGDKNEKYGEVIKAPDYMNWPGAPKTVYSKVLEANKKVQILFDAKVKDAKGKDTIVVDMTNMNSGARKVALKSIEGVESEYHKTAVVFNFKGAEEIIKKMAVKRSEESNKTIPPAAFDRMFTSYDLQDDKGIPFDEVKIKDVLSKEGFDEVEMKDNTVELKRVIDEYEKSKSVAESKNTMKYIKTFESFNEGIIQKATDFIKDPTGKKRAAVAAEEELDKSNRDSEDSAKKAESSKRKAELDAEEKEYRSKLSPDQLKKLADSEDGEHRHEVMLGNAPQYTDGYFTYYHTRKNKWDK
jgi:flagellar biosynthesis GTPase FlhF